MMQLWLLAMALVVSIDSILAVCNPVSYSSNTQCEEALASESKTYPTCSSLNFHHQLLICELHSRADLDALKFGRRVLQGLPVSNEENKSHGNSQKSMFWLNVKVSIY